MGDQPVLLSTSLSWALGAQPAMGCGGPGPARQSCGPYPSLLGMFFMFVSVHVTPFGKASDR